VKRLVLLGGGHSHLAVLKRFCGAPPAGTDLALVSPHRHALYSGMVPGLIAGHYGLDDCRIDLEPLALRAGARFLRDSAIGLDSARREVLTAKGGRLPYDLLSLDVGSAVEKPARASEHALGVRPIEEFLAAWERLRNQAARGEVERIAVVGGGAAGVELVLAMQHRLAEADAEFAVFSDSPLLPGHDEEVRRMMARILEERGVAIHVGRKVVAVGRNELRLQGGERFEAQAAVWATGARPPSWIAPSGLATDEHGFVAVGETLQSTSHREVFAAGDVAAAGRPKSGVFAVRQGPALARNLRRALAGKAPQAFRSPERSLALISCGGRYAVASWGRFAFEGEWVWRWKDRIDRRFVGRYGK
jgi:selenide,water dikinase